MKPVTVGMVGTGYIARVHATALAMVPEVRIVAAASRTDDARASFVRDFDVARSYRSAEELIADAEVDAIILSTPNVVHHAHAVAALAAGKHLFVEKPMACSLAEAREMTDAAARAGRSLMVGHVWRFDEEVLHVRRTVDTGQVGRVYRTHGYGTHENWGPGGWFVDPARAWGGALADMGIHAIDTARFLIGDPLPVRVHAVAGAWTGAVDGVEDTALVTIEWANGVVSTIEAGWWQPYVEAPEAATRLYGTRGFASLFPTFTRTRDADHAPRAGDTPGYDAQLQPLAEDRPTFTPRSDHCDPRAYAAQMETFVESVRSGKAVSPGGEEGLVNVAIVEAAYRSAATQQVVTLAL